MTPSVKTIRLYGKLGTQFGREFHIAVASAREAIQALSAMVPGFEQELITSQQRGIGYAVFIDKRNLNEDQIDDPAGGTIRIAPIIMGAKRGGLFSIVLGAAMVFAPWASAGFVATAVGPVGSAIMNIGAALALGGMAQLISPQQKGLSTRDGPDNGASYNFNGPVNTTAQGNPVPVLYGRMIVGGATISAGIMAEDQQ